MQYRKERDSRRLINSAEADERDKVRSRSDREGALGYKLERLCRYITRPAIAEKRLSLTNQGKVSYELKTPYRDGTTHVIFDPVDLSPNLPPLMTGVGRNRTFRI